MWKETLYFSCRLISGVGFDPIFVFLFNDNSSQFICKILLCLLSLCLQGVDI